ncbi:hypothetical protein Stube_12060 [Streptomyces tubercidicus]|uniref:Uncharacterized protein n=1 Tax=Streptomyces tubercidicus TaxID=47759 RepID=A0A640UKG3_9ACTN|nr:hypothetical protein Stube_12060 [Streptomyces tubercidicus]
MHLVDRVHRAHLVCSARQLNAGSRLLGALWEAGAGSLARVGRRAGVREGTRPGSGIDQPPNSY